MAETLNMLEKRSGMMSNELYKLMAKKYLWPSYPARRAFVPSRECEKICSISGFSSSLSPKKLRRAILGTNDFSRPRKPLCLPCCSYPTNGS